MSSSQQGRAATRGLGLSACRLDFESRGRSGGLRGGGGEWSDNARVGDALRCARGDRQLRHGDLSTRATDFLLDVH
eukprot:6267711-Prymnesium_polylepis.1